MKNNSFHVLTKLKPLDSALEFASVCLVGKVRLKNIARFAIKYLSISHLRKMNPNFVLENVNNPLKGKNILIMDLEAKSGVMFLWEEICLIFV